MFKEALSSLTSSIVGAAHATLREYKPTSENYNGSFERIAEQGISNLAYRSPILADMAHTMLQNFQLQTARKEKFREYVKNKSSDGLRKDVTASMGAGTSAQKIDAEMVRILSKISNTIDSQGKDEAKKSEIFKQFGKHFTKFQKTTAPPKSPKDTDTNHNSPGSGSGGDNSAILAKIENNTQRTFNVLEEMVARGGLGSGGSSGGNKGMDRSFIDPMTGMPSVSAAIGSIGGSLLGKIFDDETIEKFANNIKAVFTGQSPVEEAINKSGSFSTTNNTNSTPNNPVPVPKAATRSRKRGGGSNSAIESALSGLSVDLNTNQNNDTVVTRDNTTEALKEGSTRISTENISESAKEIEAANNRRSNDLKDIAIEHKNISAEILEELKLINVNLADPKCCDNKSSIDPKDRTKSPVDEAIEDVAKEKIFGNKKVPVPAGSGTGAAARGAGGAAEALGVGVAAAGAAGGAGAAAGAAASGGMGVGTGVAVGAAGAAAGAGVAAAGGATGIGAALLAAAPYVLGAAAIGAVGYGGYKLYEHFTKKDEPINPQNGQKVDVNTKPNAANEAIASNVKAAKTNATAQISDMTTAKQKENEKTAQPKPPVIIHTGGNGGGNSQSSSSQTVVTSSPVRNNESTFERVQMQDFWPRMA